MAEQGSIRYALAEEGELVSHHTRTLRELGLEGIIMHHDPITERTRRSGTEKLAERDPDLNHIFVRLGYPPMWTRDPGFASLVRVILEQQVSIKAAATLFERLASNLGEVSSGSILDAGEMSN